MKSLAMAGAFPLDRLPFMNSPVAVLPLLFALLLPAGAGDFRLEDGDRVARVGGGLLEGEQRHGYLETVLVAGHAGRDVRFRNLAWSGDTPTGRSRASFDWHKGEEEWFEYIRRPLVEWEPTVVVLGYGMASSFDGEAGLEKFGRDYRRLIERIREALPEAPPRFLLLGPIRHENLGPPLPDPAEHNAVLERYHMVIAGIAREEGLPFIGPFHRLESEVPFTRNGIHPDARGYHRLAGLVADSLGLPGGWHLALDAEGEGELVGGGGVVWSRSGEGLSFAVRESALPLPRRDERGAPFPGWVGERRISAPGLAPGRWQLEIDGRAVAVAEAEEWAGGVVVDRGGPFDRAEELRQRIVEKNRLFLHRYRPQNHTYLFGFRRHEQGNNAGEIPAFDPLIAEREEAILQAARPRLHHYRLVPASGDVPTPPPPRGFAGRAPAVREPVEAQPLPEFRLAEGLEISLWASNPMLHKPIHVNFDARGRLWVASSSVYPQIRPGEAAEDTIVVLEDADRDGFAERSTVFAGGLLIPTGVVPGDGGAYVSQSTDLLHFRDTDGDGRADRRRVVLSGFGTEDTHHMLHSLRWGPDGQLYMNQSIYIHSHIETPHGVRRLNSGGIWHFRPGTLELGVFLKGFCNPWGHAFDRHGQSFVTDGAGSQGINYGVPGAMYFTYAGAARTLASISPGHYPKFCGLELLHSGHFPESWQGMALTCDFRAHRIVPFLVAEEGSGYTAQEGPEWVRGEGSTFRPVDLKVGPDGALYVADWSNPVIQHGEVDFRDPRRDKVHGRIWRITHKGRPPLPRSELTGASDEELLDHLLSPGGFAARQSARLLTERGPAIRPALDAWIRARDSEEALLQGLWLHQSLDLVRPDLLDRLLEAGDGRVRAAAVRVLRFWQERLDTSLDRLARSIADPHPRVRLEAARALAVHPDPGAVPILLELLDHPMDRFLDYALWLGINERAGDWIEAVREGRWKPMGRERQLEFALQAIPSRQASRVLEMLLPEGGLEGEGPWIEIVGRAGGPEHLGRLLDRLVAGEMGSDVGIRVLQALGEAHRLRKAMPSGADRIDRLFDATDPSLQAHALRLAGAWKLHRFENRFLEKAGSATSPRVAQEAAIDALRRLDSDSAARKLRELLTRPESLSSRSLIARALATMDLAESLESILWVMNRRESTPELGGIWEVVLRQKDAERLVIGALRDSTLAPEAARAGLRAARSTGRAMTDLQLALEQAGGLDPSGSDATRQRVRELTERAASGGDPDRGEAVYRRPELGCVLCHAVGGIGGHVGPDLTSIGASAPPDYLSESLLLPNDRIKEGYHSTIVETGDGEEYSGILVRETGEELILRTAANRELSLPLVDVAERRTGGSLMPSGLIDALSPRDQADLVRFLSRLGRPGRFDASRANVARQWHLRPGRFTEEQFGLERIVSRPDPRQWRSASTLVDGRLTRPALQQALRLPGVHQATGLVGLFARTRLHLAREAEVTLDLSAPGDARLWIDAVEMPVVPSRTLRLEAGAHDIVLRLDPGALPDAIRIESSAGTFPVE